MTTLNESDTGKALSQDDNMPCEISFNESAAVGKEADCEPMIKTFADQATTLRCLPASCNWYLPTVMTVFDDGHKLAFGAKGTVVIMGSDGQAIKAFRAHEGKFGNKVISLCVLQKVTLQKISTSSQGEEDDNEKFNLSILVTLSDSSLLRFWDVSRPSSMGKAKGYLELGGEQSHVCVEPMQNMLFVGCSDGGIIQILVMRQDDHSNTQKDLGIGSTRLNVLRSSTEIREAAHPVTILRSLQCSDPQSSQLLASGHTNGVVLVWSVPKQRPGDISPIFLRHKLQGGHAAPVQSLSCLPLDIEQQKEDDIKDCWLLSTGRDRKAILWNALNGEKVVTKEQPGGKQKSKGGKQAFNVACLISKTHAVMSGSSGELWLISLFESNVRAELLPRSHSRTVFNMVLSPVQRTQAKIASSTLDSRPAAGSSRRLEIFTSGLDRVLAKWHIDVDILARGDSKVQQSCKRCSSFAIPCLGGFAYSLASCPGDTPMVAVGCGDDMVRVWDVAHPQSTYQTRTIWKGLQAKVTVLSAPTMYSQDDSSASTAAPLFAGLEDGRLLHLALKSGICTHIEKCKHHCRKSPPRWLHSFHISSNIGQHHGFLVLAASAKTICVHFQQVKDNKGRPNSAKESPKIPAWSKELKLPGALPIASFSVCKVQRLQQNAESETAGHRQGFFGNTVYLSVLGCSSAKAFLATVPLATKEKRGEVSREERPENDAAEAEMSTKHMGDVSSETGSKWFSVIPGRTSPGHNFVQSEDFNNLNFQKLREFTQEISCSTIQCMQDCLIVIIGLADGTVSLNWRSLPMKSSVLGNDQEEAEGNFDIQSSWVALKLHHSKVTCISLFDKETFATGSVDGTVQIWRIQGLQGDSSSGTVAHYDTPAAPSLRLSGLRNFRCHTDHVLDVCWMKLPPDHPSSNLSNHKCQIGTSPNACNIRLYSAGLDQAVFEYGLSLLDVHGSVSDNRFRHRLPPQGKVFFSAEQSAALGVIENGQHNDGRSNIEKDNVIPAKRTLQMQAEGNQRQQSGQPFAAPPVAKKPRAVFSNLQLLPENDNWNDLVFNLIQGDFAAVGQQSHKDEQEQACFVANATSCSQVASNQADSLYANKDPERALMAASFGGMFSGHLAKALREESSCLLAVCMAGSISPGHARQAAIIAAQTLISKKNSSLTTTAASLLSAYGMHETATSTLLKAKLLKDAVVCSASLPRTNPVRVEAWTQLASLYERNGQQDQAAMCYVHAGMSHLAQQCLLKTCLSNDRHLKLFFCIAKFEAMAEDREGGRDHTMTRRESVSEIVRIVASLADRGRFLDVHTLASGSQLAKAALSLHAALQETPNMNSLSSADSNLLDTEAADAAAAVLFDRPISYVEIGPSGMQGETSESIISSGRDASTPRRQLWRVLLEAGRGSRSAALAAVLWWQQLHPLQRSHTDCDSTAQRAYLLEKVVGRSGKDSTVSVVVHRMLEKSDEASTQP